MFESEIRIEVERRLQKACDDRALAGLPPPVSIDALRAIVRSDLLREVEAAQAFSRAAVVKPAPPPLKSAPSVPKVLAASLLKPEAAPKLSATERLAQLAGKMDLREPVFPSLRGPAKKSGSVVDHDELAVRAILEAGRAARGR
ncbi:hypothetical protein [Methylobacterium sp. CM6257]